MGARPRLRESNWAKDQAYAIEIGHSSKTALPITSAVYHVMPMSQNYAEALFDRDIVFPSDRIHLFDGKSGELLRNRAMLTDPEKVIGKLD